MPVVRILTEAELRLFMALDLAAIDCIEGAFAALAGGKVVMPPVLSMEMPTQGGEVDVKTAFVPGLPSFAIKVSPGFFGNPALGLPSTSGLMMLFSAQTGMLEALLLDNGYLTDLRTAAAGAVAARHLSRQDASTACILGTGVQARLQLAALCLVRPITRAVIWGRDADRAEKAAQDMAERQGIDVRAVPDAETAARQADIIVTTTPATAPILQAGWLKPGQHVTAMGSDQHSKSELAPDCLTAADLYVPDRLSQTRVIGELRSAIAAGLIAPDREFAELGAMIAGSAPGRQSDDQVTIADLTGTGVQDTAIANLAATRATETGAGTRFDT